LVKEELGFFTGPPVGVGRGINLARSVFTEQPDSETLPAAGQAGPQPDRDHRQHMVEAEERVQEPSPEPARLAN